MYRLPNKTVDIHPPTCPFWPSSYITTSPAPDHPAYIAACLLVILAALIDIVWPAIPTAKYIYAEFPSAVTLDKFTTCILGGLIYVLGSMVILTVVARVCWMLCKSCPGYINVLPGKAGINCCCRCLCGFWLCLIVCSSKLHQRRRNLW